MRSGGVMRVCFTFRHLRSGRCRVELKNLRRPLAEYKAKALEW